MVASAETLKGGLPICRTEDDLDEFMKNAERVVAEGRCIIAKRGIEVVVLGGFIVKKIRVYVPGTTQSMIFYTPMENIAR